MPKNADTGGPKKSAAKKATKAAGKAAAKKAPRKLSGPRAPRRIFGMDADQRKEERRRIILETALELYGTKGYAPTSIEVLCQTAGVGTNSFYEIFDNKEDVIIALDDQLTAQIEAAVQGELAGSTASGSELLRVVVESFVRALVTDPRVARVNFVEVTGVSPRVEAHRRAGHHAFAELMVSLADRIEPGYPRGRTRPDRAKPHRSMLGLLGANAEIITDWILDPDPDPVEQLIDDLVRFNDGVIAALIASR